MVAWSGPEEPDHAPVSASFGRHRDPRYSRPRGARRAVHGAAVVGVAPPVRAVHGSHVAEPEPAMVSDVPPVTGVVAVAFAAVVAGSAPGAVAHALAATAAVLPPVSDAAVAAPVATAAAVGAFLAHAAAPAHTVDAVAAALAMVGAVAPESDVAVPAPAAIAIVVFAAAGVVAPVAATDGLADGPPAGIRASRSVVRSTVGHAVDRFDPRCDVPARGRLRHHVWCRAIRSGRVSRSDGRFVANARGGR